MQKELANVLKGKLLLLPFADIVAGLAQTLTTQEPTPDNSATITARRPVSYDVTKVGGDPCLGTEVALVPDGTAKSIIYFEDLGIVATGTRRRLQGFTSSLRLIAWLDRSKLVGDHYTEITGRCITAILKALAHRNPQNIGIFTRLTIDAVRIPAQDAGLFSRYTYTETDKQYLRPPYEFFGIDFDCRFFVPSKCMDTIPWNVATC